MKLSDKLSTLPASPGVYLMKDKGGNIIYVGKAKSMRTRVRSYWREQDSPKTQHLVSKIKDLEVITTPTELDALVLENTLIKQYQPYYNMRLKDDKRYPYLKVTVNEQYPRLMIVRKYQNDGARYFGPYTGRNMILSALRELSTVFKLRDCTWPSNKLPKKTCLQFQIKRCMGPCEFPETSAEYRKSVDDLLLFLEGKQQQLLKRLEADMRSAAASEQFEKAALLRDKVAKIVAIFQRQGMVIPTEADEDYIVFFEQNGAPGIDVLQVREGKVLANEVIFFTESLDDESLLERQLISYYERKGSVPDTIVTDRPLSDIPLFGELLQKQFNRTVSLRHEPEHELIRMAQRNIEVVKIRNIKVADENALEELQQALEIDFLPRYIEAYDISNTGGSNIIGAKVVFKDGKPWKTAYRKFNIKSVTGDPNDFQSLHEMLTRRCQRLAEQERPEEADNAALPRLFLIDGGKGQLGIAENVVRTFKLDIPVISIAKEHEDIYYQGGRLIPLPKNSAAQKLLQRLRDEVHRFGITAHRQKRAKTSFASVLDDIPGVGPSARTALLKKFTDIHGISRASQKALGEVLSAKTAERVYNYFHGGPSL